MNRLLYIPIFCFLGACSKDEKPNTPSLLDTGLIVQNEFHQVIIWINDEPVKVFIPGKSGPIPLLMFGKKGENYVHATIENTSNNPGQASIEIMEGKWDEPESMIHHFSWTSDQPADKSPTHAYHVDEPLLSIKEGLQPISVSQDQAKQLIRDHFEKCITAYQNKEPESLGIKKEALDKMMMASFGVDNFSKKVFEADDYVVRVLATPDDLELIIGERTILGYSKKGEVLLKAGPLDRKTENGEMIFSTSFESISLGFDGEKWVPAY